MNKPVYIIAEVGVNHDGSLKKAKEMVRLGADAGVDAVKFQTFNAEKLVTSTAEKAEYQEVNTGSKGSQQKMLEKLSLSHDEFRELKILCDEVGVDFLSTPFDNESADFLNDMGMKAFKVPSGEFDNLPYLEKIASFNKPIIISTGLSDLKDIQKSIDIVIAGGAKREHLTVLHCNSDYPTKMDDVNLSAMQAIGKQFNVTIGYSDHTIGIEVPIAAVALGAKVIEKHFTLDKSLEGPDHVVSLEPDELKEMVVRVRNIEKALGQSEKVITQSALKNREIARRSIVASSLIKKGETLTEENITVKRPGRGISPLKWHDVIGTIAIADYSKDDYIEVKESQNEKS